MKKTLLIATLSLLFTVGCQTKNTIDNQTKTTDNMTSNTHQLIKIKWQLAKFEQKVIKKSSPQTELPYILLHKKDNKVIGLAGCNNFFGTYEQNRNHLNFSHFGITMMACHDSPVQEHLFIQALENTDNYVIKDNQLILKQGDKDLAVFQASTKTK